MNRKSHFKIGKTNAGTSYFLTGKNPDVRVNDSTQTYKARAGERLDHIAYKMYGDPTHWWIIAKANGITNGTFALNDPRILKIPSLSMF